MSVRDRNFCTRGTRFGAKYSSFIFANRRASKQTQSVAAGTSFPMLKKFLSSEIALFANPIIPAPFPRVYVCRHGVERAHTRQINTKQIVFKFVRTKNTHTRLEEDSTIALIDDRRKHLNNRERGNSLIRFPSTVLNKPCRNVNCFVRKRNSRKFSEESFLKLTAEILRRRAVFVVIKNSRK